MTAKQQAIRQAADACDALQKTRSPVDFHQMQKAVQAAQNQGASLPDIAAARRNR